MQFTHAEKKTTNVQPARYKCINWAAAAARAVIKGFGLKYMMTVDSSSQRKGGKP